MEQLRAVSELFAVPPRVPSTWCWIIGIFLGPEAIRIAHYREVRDNKAAPPASTAIGVPQLARPGALFEVEAVAVLPPK
jgi:hypothetical protein